MKTVSRNQIIRLTKLIRETWDALGQPGFVPGETTLTAAFNSWRRNELFLCTSNAAASFNDVLNKDFERIEVHFFKLGGNLADALNAAIAQQNSEKLRHLACISKNLAAAAVATGQPKKWSMAYAATISKAEYGKMPDALAIQQLRQLTITIAQRTRSAIRKADGAPVTTAPVADSEEAAIFAAADEEAASQSAESYEPESHV